MRKKKPYSKFVEIALEGQLEMQFCDLFTTDGEPHWSAMDSFLNGSKNDKKVGFLDAFERRIKGEKVIHEPKRWDGVPEANKKDFMRRTGNALSKGKAPTPNQKLKAACWLFHANVLTGGDIPNGVRKNQANIRRLEIINPMLTKTELKEAYNDSGLSDTALVYAREFCEEFEGLKLPDERYNKPI